MYGKNIAFCILFFALSGALAAGGCAGEKETRTKAVRADGKWLKDSEGRVVILRGINAGADSKVAPFEPFASERNAEQIANWGMNAVRYVVVWEAIEPKKSAFDDAFLDRMAEKVDWLTSRGIYVFIDMHQDLYSGKFCGDGAPGWAAEGDPEQLAKPCGSEWFMNYPSTPVTDAFDRFWKDDELQSHFAEAFRMVAARLSGNDMVIGYELFNEPWHGRCDLRTGKFENDYLAPFYGKVIRSIRKADPAAIVFFEPALFAGGLFTMQSRLSALGFPNLVYSPHYYTLGSLTGTEKNVDAAIESIGEDLGLVLEKAAELGTPALLSEFGVHPDQEDGFRFLQGYYNMLDEYLMGGTVWCYAERDEWNGEGVSLITSDLEEKPFVNAVVRPYAMAVAGTPTLMSFDAETGVFRIEFDEAGVRAQTVIYAPERVYPNGPSVSASDGKHTFDEARRLVFLEAGRSKSKHWIEITP